MVNPPIRLGENFNICLEQRNLMNVNAVVKGTDWYNAQASSEEPTSTPDQCYKDA